MAYRSRSRIRGRGQFTAPESREGGRYIYDGRSVNIKGENFQLNWNGPQVVNEILRALQDALNDLSAEALEHMQAIVPVDTGALRDSSFATVIVGDTGRIQLAIGAGMPYAVYVELGTFSHAAQPYIRPTFDFVIKQLPGILKAAVESRAK
jgi:bacteriophage HK97-gp10 putative tail-component